ncbi:MAG: hypothetical protein Q8O41_00965 [Candidatus Methanoperedens sp.]|nr:hypothetical protein [Candidatus Methanoperedens sp.]
MSDCKTELDCIPPLYREPLLALVRIRDKHGMDSVPYSTVLFIFEGYRFSKKRTLEILSELCRLGILERIAPNVFYMGYKIHLTQDDGGREDTVMAEDDMDQSLHSMGEWI